jgi:histidine triad (HIT) family protein
MNDCIFCSISEKHTPSYLFFEDEKTIAFLDYQPSVEGHSLVILKKHGETLLDYTEDEVSHLWKTVREVLPSLEHTLHTNIFTIGINHNEPGGIHHLHVHIIPRYQNDNGGIIQTIVKSRIIDDLSVVQKKIKGYIHK